MSTDMKLPLLDQIRKFSEDLIYATDRLTQLKSADSLYQAVWQLSPEQRVDFLNKPFSIGRIRLKIDGDWVDISRNTISQAQYTKKETGEQVMWRLDPNDHQTQVMINDTSQLQVEGKVLLSLEAAPSNISTKHQGSHTVKPLQIQAKSSRSASDEQQTFIKYNGTLGQRLKEDFEYLDVQVAGSPTYETFTLTQFFEMVAGHKKQDEVKVDDSTLASCQEIEKVGHWLVSMAKPAERNWFLNAPTDYETDYSEAKKAHDFLKMQRYAKLHSSLGAKFLKDIGDLLIKAVRDNNPEVVAKLLDLPNFPIPLEDISEAYKLANEQHFEQKTSQLKLVQHGLELLVEMRSHFERKDSQLGIFESVFRSSEYQYEPTSEIPLLRKAYENTQMYSDFKKQDESKEKDRGIQTAKNMLDQKAKTQGTETVMVQYKKPKPKSAHSLLISQAEALVVKDASDVADRLKNIVVEPELLENLEKRGFLAITPRNLDRLLVELDQLAKTPQSNPMGVVHLLKGKKLKIAPENMRLIEVVCNIKGKKSLSGKIKRAQQLTITDETAEIVEEIIKKKKLVPEIEVLVKEAVKETSEKLKKIADNVTLLMEIEKKIIDVAPEKPVDVGDLVVAENAERAEEKNSSEKMVSFQIVREEYHQAKSAFDELQNQYDAISLQAKVREILFKRALMKLLLGRYTHEEDQRMQERSILNDIVRGEEKLTEPKSVSASRKQSSLSDESKSSFITETTPEIIDTDDVVKTTGRASEEVDKEQAKHFVIHNWNRVFENQLPQEIEMKEFEALDVNTPDSNLPFVHTPRTDKPTEAPPRTKSSDSDSDTDNEDVVHEDNTLYEAFLLKGVEALTVAQEIATKNSHAEYQAEISKIEKKINEIKDELEDLKSKKESAIDKHVESNSEVWSKPGFGEDKNDEAYKDYMFGLEKIKGEFEKQIIVRKERLEGKSIVDETGATRFQTELNATLNKKTDEMNNDSIKRKWEKIIRGALECCSYLSKSVQMPSAANSKDGQSFQPSDEDLYVNKTGAELASETYHQGFQPFTQHVTEAEAARQLVLDKKKNSLTQSLNATKGPKQQYHQARENLFKASIPYIDLQFAWNAGRLRSVVSILSFFNQELLKMLDAEQESSEAPSNKVIDERALSKDSYDVDSESKLDSDTAGLTESTPVGMDESISSVTSGPLSEAPIVPPPARPPRAARPLAGLLPDIAPSIPVRGDDNGGRSDLLAAIRAGKALKKAPISEEWKASSNGSTRSGVSTESASQPSAEGPHDKAAPSPAVKAPVRLSCPQSQPAPPPNPRIPSSAPPAGRRPPPQRPCEAQRKSKAAPLPEPGDPSSASRTIIKPPARPGRG